MNPCAATFTPGFSSPDHATSSSTQNGPLVERLGPSVPGPARLGVLPRSSLLVADQYDLEFPSLPSTAPGHRATSKESLSDDAPKLQNAGKDESSGSGSEDAPLAFVVDPKVKAPGDAAESPKALSKPKRFVKEEQGSGPSAQFHSTTSNPDDFQQSNFNISSMSVSDHETPPVGQTVSGPSWLQPHGSMSYKVPGMPAPFIPTPMPVMFNAAVPLCQPSSYLQYPGAFGFVLPIMLSPTLVPPNSAWQELRSRQSSELGPQSSSTSSRQKTPEIEVSKPQLKELLSRQVMQQSSRSDKSNNKVSQTRQGSPDAQVSTHLRDLRTNHGVASPPPILAGHRFVLVNASQPSDLETPNYPVSSGDHTRAPGGQQDHRVECVLETGDTLNHGGWHTKQSRDTRPTIKAETSTINKQMDIMDLPLQHNLRYRGFGSHPQNPPSNAPTGPASQRHTPIISSTQAHTSETGAWSQSKRWMSSENRERQAFQKMVANLRYMGADKSPFVPQNPAELTAFKAEMAEIRRRKLAEEVSRRLAKTPRMGESNPAIPSQSELLLGKHFDDNLSPVFAAENCFNKNPPVNDTCRVDWPSLAEFKEEGDKRASRYGRYFPLPRMNAVAPRILERENSGVFNPDGSIHWENKAVKHGFCDIMPISAPHEVEKTPAVELLSEELPFGLQPLLLYIDGGDLADGKKEKHKEDKQAQD